MRPFHITGLGMIIGLTAFGALMAMAALQWQERDYPSESFAPIVQGEGGAQQATPAAAPKPGSLSPAQIAQAVSRGQAVFQQKCAGCHTIGAGKVVGPDLKGVTAQRDRAWLVEFISAPDKVFARNDPIAVQLKAEYGGLEMPNTGVTSAQAGDILYYIDSKSQ